MGFASLADLTKYMRRHGAVQIFAKALAENDNSKQQVYLGGSFEVLQLLPHTHIRTETLGKRPNFKAALDFSWIDDSGQQENAPHAQLILYPDYPEVRLSGFLLGCKIAPSKAMQPVPKIERRHLNGPDGRVLFFGVTEDRRVLAYLALHESALAGEFFATREKQEFLSHGVFDRIPSSRERDAKFILLDKLREIHIAGGHSSRRLNRDGQVIEYSAQNGGGFTLEALLGIRPNSNAAPDYLGWEIKAYSGDKVTLMTPEPDSGYYKSHGVQAFVRKYGHPTKNDVLYFTGVHRADVTCPKTALTMTVRGFDFKRGVIEGVEGGIELLDQSGDVAAAWGFEGLLTHWSRKHSAAAYVKYSKNKSNPPMIEYLSPVHLGEGTSFPLYMSAIHSGVVYYDPGTKVMNASTTGASHKARSQFRISVKKLATLYTQFYAVDLQSV